MTHKFTNALHLTSQLLFKVNVEVRSNVRRKIASEVLFWLLHHLTLLAVGYCIAFDSLMLRVSVFFTWTLPLLVGYKSVNRQCLVVLSYN